jgi:23S rRNA pseudouridine1911/1915/1917 synthase
VENKLVPEEGHIDILFEDEHFIAIQKPTGLLSHPNPGHNEGSLLNVLLYMGYQLQGGDDPIRHGLIHRLDRDTTGVLLLSKSTEAYDKFQQLFKQRVIDKTYHFPAYGQVRRMEFTRKDPLGRHNTKRNTRVVDPEGRTAETHFKLIELFNHKYTLWKASPKTGRTHQIRVHAQCAGLSVLGDPHYSEGIATQTLSIKPKRTLLHCSKLSFNHPLTGQHLEIKAPYPEDFKHSLDELKSLKKSAH